MIAVIIFMFGCFAVTSIYNPAIELKKHSITINGVWLIFSIGGGLVFMFYLYNAMIPELQTKATMIWLFVFGIIFVGCGGVLLRYCAYCISEKYRENKEFFQIIKQSNKFLRQCRKRR